FHLFFLYPPRHPRSLPSFPTRRSSDLPETGNGIPAKHMKIMKTKERIRKIADSRWARTLALAVTAAIIFSWLYSHGISPVWTAVDRKSTRLNSSHVSISYAVFCLKKKT